MCRALIVITIAKANHLVDARWHHVNALDQPPVVNVRFDVHIGDVVEPIEVEGGDESLLALLRVFFELLLGVWNPVLSASCEGFPVPFVRSTGKFRRLFALSRGHSTFLGGLEQRL